MGALVSNLTVNQTYQVDIPAGFIVDSNGNSYVGTAYTFTTQPAAGLIYTWEDMILDNWEEESTANVATSSPVQVPGTTWGDLLVWWRW